MIGLRREGTSVLRVAVVPLETAGQTLGQQR
jgi:hypothetical protein